LSKHEGHSFFACVVFEQFCLLLIDSRFSKVAFGGPHTHFGPILPGVLSEAQNRFGFGIIQGMVSVTGTFQAWHQVVALLASYPQHLSLKGARHGDHA